MVFVSLINLSPLYTTYAMIATSSISEICIKENCFIRVLYDDLSRKSIEKCIEIHKLIAKYVKSVENTLVMKKKYDIIIHVSSW